MKEPLHLFQDTRFAWVDIGGFAAREEPYPVGHSPACWCQAAGPLEMTLDGSFSWRILEEDDA